MCESSPRALPHPPARPVTDSEAAIEKLRAELHALGVTDAYEIGDGETLSVWVGLVVRYRDGAYLWKEGPNDRRHPSVDPTGCAALLARRYAELTADRPSWWEDLSEVLRGDAVEGRP
jgi:hypothetical protein